MLWLLQRRSADLELAFFVDAFGDRRVHSVGINVAHDRVLAFVHILAPDGDAKFAGHSGRKMNLET